MIANWVEERGAMSSSEYRLSREAHHNASQLRSVRNKRGARQHRERHESHERKTCRLFDALYARVPDHREG